MFVNDVNSFLSEAFSTPSGCQIKNSLRIQPMPPALSKKIPTPICPTPFFYDFTRTPIEMGAKKHPKKRGGDIFIGNSEKRFVRPFLMTMSRISRSPMAGIFKKSASKAKKRCRRNALAPGRFFKVLIGVDSKPEIPERFAMPLISLREFFA
jgi:hypothetical protein